MSSAYDIQGRNCIFQMKIGDVYMDVICAKTFSFNRVYELKETTTVLSGFDKEFRPRKKSYTISFNGVVQVVADLDKPTIKTLFDYAEGFLPIAYRIIYEDNSGNLMVIVGWAYVNSAIFNANPINLLDGTVEMTGNGPVQILDEIPDIANITIVSLGDNSINATFQFKLFNENGDIVFDSGQLPEASGGNLTHPVNVTGTVQKGTYSLFWQADAQSLGNAFELDAPPTKASNFNSGITNESTFGVQEYDFTADRQVSFTLGVPDVPPVCVPPGFISGLNNPASTEGSYWFGQVVVSGSMPITISNLIKPAWVEMTANTNAGIITFQGYAEAGIDQEISFTATNACGTIDYLDSIDVSDNPDGVSIEVNYLQDIAPPASGSGCKVFINAALFYSFTATNLGNHFIANPGDIIEIQVFGPPPTFGNVTKHIDIQDSIDGEIYNDETVGVIESTTFTATLGHEYTINASATNG